MLPQIIPPPPPEYLEKPRRPITLPSRIIHLIAIVKERPQSLQPGRRQVARRPPPRKGAVKSAQVSPKRHPRKMIDHIPLPTRRRTLHHLPMPPLKHPIQGPASPARRSHPSQPPRPIHAGSQVHYLP